MENAPVHQALLSYLKAFCICFQKDIERKRKRTDPVDVIARRGAKRRLGWEMACLENGMVWMLHF